MTTDEVYQWYRENELDPWDFHCPHLPECSAEASDDEFVTATPPTIGERYEEGTIPRLLVISSEAASDNGLPQKGDGFTTSGIDPRAHDHPGGKHWSETYRIVLEIQRTFDPELSLEQARCCFAHERAVKCTASKDDSSESSDTLFQNCRGFIPDQLTVYRPDIILTQGRRAQWAVRGGDYLSMDDWRSCGREGHDCEYRVIKVSDELQPLWIRTYHPTSRPQYYPNYRDGYFECYPEVVADHLEDV